MRAKESQSLKPDKAYYITWKQHHLRIAEEVSVNKNHLNMLYYVIHNEVCFEDCRSACTIINLSQG